MPAKILVVDDEVHLARIIQFTLEHEGFDVIIAFDGEEANGIWTLELTAHASRDRRLPGL